MTTRVEDRANPTEILRQGAFDHIRGTFRGKVASDFLARVTPEGRWRYGTFNKSNDYQRHLHALFLKLAGLTYSEVRERLFPMLGDVSPEKRESYLDDVLHSEIVGFPWDDGTFSMLPHQKVAGMEE